MRPSHRLRSQRNRDTAKTKGAEQISPAELEKKYEEARQLLVTPEYISRSSLHGDSKYKKARQFLNLAHVVSSTRYVEVTVARTVLAART